MENAQTQDSQKYVALNIWLLVQIQPRILADPSPYIMNDEVA